MLMTKSQIRAFLDDIISEREEIYSALDSIEPASSYGACAVMLDDYFDYAYGRLAELNDKHDALCAKLNELHALPA